MEAAQDDDVQDRERSFLAFGTMSFGTRQRRAFDGDDVVLDELAPGIEEGEVLECGGTRGAQVLVFWWQPGGAFELVTAVLDAERVDRELPAEGEGCELEGTGEPWWWICSSVQM
jgi:hypothetical protein